MLWARFNDDFESFWILITGVEFIITSVEIFGALSTIILLLRICETINSTINPVFCNFFKDSAYERFKSEIPLTAIIWEYKKN